MNFLEYLVYIFKCIGVLFGIVILFDLTISVFKNHTRQKKLKKIQDEFIKKLKEEIEKDLEKQKEKKED